MKPLLLKAGLLNSQGLLRVIEQVLRENPLEFFLWVPESDEDLKPAGSFDYEEWDNTDPMCKLHLERADESHVSITIADGMQADGGDDENREGVRFAFSRLFELTRSSRKEEVGQLELIAE